jgi:hypothetical protein
MSSAWTPEELEALIAQSPSVKPEMDTTEPGGFADTAKAFGAGAAQGALFNWGDELLAGVVAPFSDKEYKELQEEYDLEDQRLAAQNPLAYGAGTVAGAVSVPGAGIGSLGLKATKLAKTSANLAKVPSGLVRATGYAAQGGTAGALDYLGRTKSEDMSLKDAATSAAFGGALGAALGETMEVAMPIAKNLLKRVDDSRTLQDIRETIDVVRKVKDNPEFSDFGLVGSRTFSEKAGSKLHETAIRTAKDLMNAEQVLGTTYKKLVNEASKNVTDPVNINPTGWIELLNRMKANTVGSEFDPAEALAKYLTKNNILSVNKDGFLIPGTRQLSIDKARQITEDLDLMMTRNPSMAELRGERGLPSIGYSEPIRNQGRQILKNIESEISTKLRQIDPKLSQKLDEISEIKNDIAIFKDLTGLENLYYGDVSSLEKDIALFIGKLTDLNDPSSVNPTGVAIRKYYEKVTSGKVNKFLGDKKVLEEMKERLKETGREKYIPEYEGLVNKYNKNLADLKDDLLFADLGGTAQQRAALGQSGRGNLGISARGLITQGTAISAEAADFLRSSVQGIIGKQATSAALRSPGAMASVLTDAGIYNYLSRLANQLDQPKIAQYLHGLYNAEGKKRAAMLYVMLQTPVFRDFVKSHLTDHLEN